MLPIQTHPDLIKTIRLDPADRRRLVEALERTAEKTRYERDRRQMRLPYVAHELVMKVHQENAGVQHQAVISRNVSRWGAALLIGRFVYPDSEIDLDLRQLDGKIYSVHGRVVRCRHVSRMVHEISVLFSRPIDLERFIEMTEEQQRRLAMEISGRLGDGDADCDDPLLSSLTQHAVVRPVIEQLVRQASDLSLELQQAAQDNSQESLALLGQIIEGLGRGCGFAPLADEARQLLTLLEASSEAADLMAQVDIMADLLRRLRCEPA